MQLELSPGYHGPRVEPMVAVGVGVLSGNSTKGATLAQGGGANTRAGRDR